MLVTMMTNMAGPDGCYRAGNAYELDDKLAKSLLEGKAEGGYAFAVRGRHERNVKDGKGGFRTIKAPIAEVIRAKE